MNMQHLSSKILSVIIACSATLLLSGLNVHATSNQQPDCVNQGRQVNVNSTRDTYQHPHINSVHKVINRHYTYQNLKTIQNNQFSLARLGAHRGRRNVKRLANRRSRRSIKRVRRTNKARNLKRQRKNSKYPQISRHHVRVIDQKRSAVNHFRKHIGYVNNPRPDNFTSSENYGDSDYGRIGTPITGNPANGKITFRRLTFIPKKLGNNQFYSPQGLVIAGHYAYVITNATNSYEASHNSDSDSNRQVPTSYVNGNKSTGASPYHLGASQIIRIHLKRHVKDYNNHLRAARRNIKVGPVFYGGHGQGLAYNPRTRQLWLLDNLEGQVTKTAASLINPRTLAPELRINFCFGDTTIGDDLTFGRNGRAYNVTEAGDDSFAKPGAIKFFTGSIKPSGVHMWLVKQGLRWAPSDVIQGLTYNQRNNRLYILGDDAVTSVPANRLGRLSKNYVWYTPFSSTREFEGLSFDHNGNGYLLISRSPEILMARYNRKLKF